MGILQAEVVRVLPAGRERVGDLHLVAVGPGVTETGLAWDRRSLATPGDPGENGLHEPDRSRGSRRLPAAQQGATGSRFLRAPAAQPHAHAGAAAGGRGPAGGHLGGLLPPSRAVPRRTSLGAGRGRARASAAADRRRVRLPAPAGRAPDPEPESIERARASRAAARARPAG